MILKFNRCHIPRLVVEEEELKKKRLEQEKRDKEELVKIMEDMDLTWEEKKRREQELLSKKKVRMSESGEGQKPKRLEMMKYRIIGEEWGEGTDGKEIDALYDVEQGAVSSSAYWELLGAETPTTMQWEQRRKRPREQQECPRPPTPTVAHCDDSKNKKKRLVMGRTIADYFKINTGEQHNVEEDLWGSSGDRDFFEGTSDQILVNWEMYYKKSPQWKTFPR